MLKTIFRCLKVIARNFDKIYEVIKDIIEEFRMGDNEEDQARVDKTEQEILDGKIPEGKKF